jgi:magnesium chelatase subunit I
MATNTRQFDSKPESPTPQTLTVMPYSMVVGQNTAKMALELAFIAPRIGGVLLSGQRGTAKSTIVRAFGQMVYGRIPVTLPINATEDRVVGDWKIEGLLRGEQDWQPGLLEEAHLSVLYIDEVNLLDDHIVNLILDVTSTNILVIEREGRNEQKLIKFTLVGTMNPSEGLLRPQLVDRFGLMAEISAENSEDSRVQILETVLGYDEAVATETSGGKGVALDSLNRARRQDSDRRDLLERARQRVHEVALPNKVKSICTKLGQLSTEGHRADYLFALAARALAARDDQSAASVDHLVQVAQLILQHRRPSSWSAADSERVKRIAYGE